MPTFSASSKRLDKALDAAVKAVTDCRKPIKAEKATW